MSDRAEEKEKMISSLEIINKTNISRATLNNYIRLRLLPKPVVDRPKEAGVRAKRVGYFPERTLDILDQVRQLKRDGYAMAQILERLRPPSSAEVSGDVSGEGGRRVAGGGDVRVGAVAKGPAGPADERSGFENPVFATFCVLAADLQEADRLGAELPDEDTFLLLNRIRQCVATMSERHRGLWDRGLSPGMMICYFVSRGDPSYLGNALGFALELRDNMREMTMVGKAEKGRFPDLRLNMGLAVGREFLGFLRTPSGREPVTFGPAAIQSVAIAESGRGGAIWMTKDLVNHLAPEERGKIRYGVTHAGREPGVFISRSFIRLPDMSGVERRPCRSGAGLETLAVTELIGRDETASLF